MQIQKQTKATITFDAYEVVLLKKYMDWARLYFEERKHTPHVLGYESEQEAKTDMAKVMEPIFDL